MILDISLLNTDMLSIQKISRKVCAIPSDGKLYSINLTTPGEKYMISVILVK